MSSSLTRNDPLAIRTQAVVMDLLRQRGRDSSICPSEAARALAKEVGGEWRELMRPVRIVVAEMADAGLLRVTQNGQVVDPAQARGPIRLTLR